MTDTKANIQPPPAPQAAGEVGRATTHGATSEHLIQPGAERWRDLVLGANPHLDAVRDGPALARYAVLLARIERVQDWLALQPDSVFVNPDAKIPKAHPILERLAKWEEGAARAEDRLGISPLARHRMGLGTGKPDPGVSAPGPLELQGSARELPGGKA
mgnify:CR=1 FL=1